MSFFSQALIELSYSFHPKLNFPFGYSVTATTNRIRKERSVITCRTSSSLININESSRDIFSD